MEEENCWKIQQKSFDIKQDLLGQGGYGTVFRGILVNKENENIENAVAIKRIEKARIFNETSTAEQAAVSVNRELVQKKLNHPNVLKLLLVDDEDENFLYFVLELCEASLEKVFLPESHPKKYRGPLPNDADFMLQLLLGLDYIHSQKLVHRDIKPENVLISTPLARQVTMKWADFGLSKATTSRGLFEMSGWRGTENYWAPEIFDLIKQKDNSSADDMEINMNMTTMSDIFSCGCVFYQFLTKGVHPFGSERNSVIANLSQPNPVMNERDLPSHHFAYKILSKMFAVKVEDRLNLKEIIPLLISIHEIIKNNPTQLFDEAYHQINIATKELYKLCSKRNPTEQHINRLTQIVSEDSIGLINIVDEYGRSPLLLLCQNNQRVSLFQLIQVMTTRSPTQGRQKRDTAIELIKEINISYQDRKGNHALHYICMNYKGAYLFKIIKLLVDLGTNMVRYSIANSAVDLIKAKAFDGRTSLHYLCRYYDKNNLINLARFLIENGVDVKAKAKGEMSDDWTVLHLVCRWYTHNNVINLIRLLVEKGVDVRATTNSGSTALHFVCHNYPHDNLINLVRFLVENGVDVNAKDSDGWTALLILCRYYPHDNLFDLAQLLMEKGVDVKATTTNGSTALHLVCQNYPHDNLIDLIRLLVENGVDVNAKTTDGSTAPHFVCKNYPHNNLIDLVRFLVENGIDVNAKDSDGWTALLILCRYCPHDNLIDLARLLIEKGIDVKAKISNGWTALHFVCQHYTHDNLIDLVRLLVENGVDVKTKTSDGLTALDMLRFNCKHKNSSNIVELLGGDPNDRINLMLEITCAIM